MVMVLLAEGFEECEALAPVDILRRGGVAVATVGIGGKTISGSHGISVVCDLVAEDACFDEMEALILPGGMPGTRNLEKSSAVQSFLDFADKHSLLIGAICAAPSILGHKGLLQGKRATCYPGFEQDLLGAEVTGEPVVRDEMIITAYGAGAAFEFGLALLSALKTPDIADEIQTGMKIKK